MEEIKKAVKELLDVYYEELNCYCDGCYDFKEGTETDCAVCKLRKLIEEEN